MFLNVLEIMFFVLFQTLFLAFKVFKNPLRFLFFSRFAISHAFLEPFFITSTPSIFLVAMEMVKNHGNLVGQPWVCFTFTCNVIKYFIEMFFFGNKMSDIAIVWKHEQLSNWIDPNITWVIVKWINAQLKSNLKHPTKLASKSAPQYFILFSLQCYF